MAQTKRRRRSKHRGNAVGVVEARGRTGRKPTSSEKKASGPSARASRPNRLDQLPTWKSATQRALIAAAIMFGVGIAILRFKPAQAIVLLPIVVLIYIPMGYYTDLFLYRRRQRRKMAR
ncbi:MAG: hypothetical protein E6G56_11415 [Actinobacteria bacterium]|nr:MAG: hypothetical protein E6G56_11415 [Actinomycetota bacterium]